MPAKKEAAKNDVVDTPKVEEKLRYRVLKGFAYVDSTGNTVQVKPFVREGGIIQTCPHTGQRLPNFIEECKSVLIPALKAKCVEEVYDV